MLKQKANILFYLFFIPSVLALISFFVNTTYPNVVYMLANVIGIVLLFFMTNIRLKKVMIVYILFYVFCTLFFPQVEGSRMYSSTVLFTNIALLFFSAHSYQTPIPKGIIEKMDFYMLFFSIIIIVGQIITIDNPWLYLTFKHDYIEEDALEQKGFLISHSFGYFLAAFSFYFAYRRKVFWVVLYTILCLFFSRRTNICLCLIAWLYYLHNMVNRKYFIVFLLVILLIFIAYINTLIMFSDFAFSLDPSDRESAEFTSGRSTFWGTYFLYVQSGHMNLWDFLIGFGPSSSRFFNESYSGLRVWMHNDFIDLAYCTGILGLALYVIAIFKCCSSNNHWLLAFILIAANLNGFILYQAYPVIYIFSLIKGFKKYGFSEKKVVSPTCFCHSSSL